MSLNESFASNQESGRSSQMKGRTSAQELRRSLLQRRQNDAVKLRKQKREERLQARRMASISSESKSSDTGSVEKALKEYLGDPKRLSVLHQTFSNSNPNAVNIVLDTLINQQPPDQAKILASRLVQALNQSSDDNTKRFLYDLLLAATASQKYSQNLQQTEENYYGLVPLRWSDVLQEVEGGTLIPSLIREVVGSPNATSSSVINLLGNLVQGSGSSAIQQVLPHWPAIIQHLPTTSYLCAAVAQEDATSLGMHLLQPHISMPHMIAMLQNETAPSCLVDMAWFLEGVTQREDGVAQKLWDTTFIQLLSVGIDTESQKGNQSFLFPICRMIGNIAESSNGELVPLIFASPLYSSLRNLLGQGSVLEILPTIATLLVDAGIPSHPSTERGIPDLVPQLWKILVMPPATVEWKREAVEALLIAMADPPHDLITPLSSQEKGPFLVVWNMSQNVDRVVLFRSILSLIRVPDQRVSLATLQLFDKLIRNIPSCKEYLEDDASFSDCLNDICNNNQGSDEARAEMAADLLDDFFEGGEDEDEDLDEAINSMFVTSGGAFRFGIPETPLPPPSHHPVAAQQQRPMGRGRGRPVPSWMSKN